MSGVRGSYHSIGEVAEPLDHPGLLADPLQELLARLTVEMASEKEEFYLGLVGDEVVANGQVRLLMSDNTHMAHVEVCVHPEKRRRGFGREMFEALKERSRDAARRVLVGWAGAPKGQEPPGAHFAKSLGAKRAQEQIRSELQVSAIDRAELGELEKEARAHSAGYELVQWIDRAPEQFVADWAELLGRMITDSPMGELKWDPERWDAERCREWERETAARGRMRLVTGAVHAESRRMVAVTDIGVSRSRPNIAYQWDTIVAPEHRGHRLGALVKLANLQALERSVRGVDSIQTWNAADNSFMLAVNLGMGFRPVEDYAAWQLEI